MTAVSNGDSKPTSSMQKWSSWAAGGFAPEFIVSWPHCSDIRALKSIREQTSPVRVGQDVVVRVYLDEKTQRILASMNLGRDSAIETPNFRTGQPVEFLITNRTSLGYKALVEGKHADLLYHEGISAAVTIGQTLKGYVRALRPDGKIDLSLDQAGYRRVAPLALRIVQALQRSGGRLGLDDDSRPRQFARHLAGARKSSHKPWARFTKPGTFAFPSPASNSWTEPPGRTRQLP
jgi:hypothetical protein